jgi:hypothetical protein
MAGNAEFCLFGALHVSVHSSHDAQSRENAQSYKRQDLPGRTCRHRRANQENGSQHDADGYLTDKNANHKASSCFLDEWKQR